MIESGATTIWETWKYSDNVYSHNHPMFGSVSEWFYRALLGINAQSPGFGTISIRPQAVEKLAWAKGSYRSVKGKIAVDWSKKDGQLFLNISIPTGIKAYIYIPNIVKRFFRCYLEVFFISFSAREFLFKSCNS